MFLFFICFLKVSGLHEWHASANIAPGPCISPGSCNPPATKFSRVVPGPEPGQQWNIAGGFCGSWSTQQCMLSAGAWISQDLVRKANRDQTGIAHNMHGDTTLGFEVMPTNVAYTATQLKANFDEFDYSQPAPQADAFKRWLKTNLARGSCVVWFPLCKGDSSTCPYDGSCPNGGVCNHVEPMFGLFSNHPLNDTTIYDDDWILHASDQDLQTYYRPINSLDDSVDMMGNCKNAQPGFGRNEMYPCFDSHVTYGLAIGGLAVNGSLPVSLAVDTQQEPNVRLHEKPIPLHGTVTVSDLIPGQKYQLFRYNSTASLPHSPPFDATADVVTNFTPTSSTWQFVDPKSFMSDTAVYYLAAEK